MFEFFKDDKKSNRLNQSHSVGISDVNAVSYPDACHHLNKLTVSLDENSTLCYLGQKQKNMES